MKFGVFSDVHGNLAALTRVWRSLSDLGLTERPVFNAGDSVGYGAEPELCIKFLEDRANIISVRGNYDRNVACFPQREEEYYKRWGRSRPEKFAAIKQDSETIGDGARQWLLSLPKEVRLNVQGRRLVLTHYSPGSKEGIGSWTSQAHLEEIARSADADVVICGHTHTPFVRRANDVLFVNPGTVGRSRWSRSGYAVLDIDPNLPPAAELRSI